MDNERKYNRQNQTADYLDTDLLITTNTLKFSKRSYIVFEISTTLHDPTRLQTKPSSAIEKDSNILACGIKQ